jgi:hypothetical protein
MVDQQARQGSELVNGFQNLMNDHYKQMRKTAGWDKPPEHSDGSDYETEEVFKKLRPKAGYKLMDLLTGKVTNKERKKAWRGSRGQRGNRSYQMARTAGEKFNRPNKYEITSSTTLSKPKIVKDRYHRSQAKTLLVPDDENTDPNQPNVETFIVDPNRITVELQQQLLVDRHSLFTKRSGYKSSWVTKNPAASVQ